MGDLCSGARSIDDCGCFDGKRGWEWECGCELDVVVQAGVFDFDFDSGRIQEQLHRTGVLQSWMQNPFYTADNPRKPHIAALSSTPSCASGTLGALSLSPLEHLGLSLLCWRLLKDVRPWIPECDHDHDFEFFGFDFDFAYDFELSDVDAVNPRAHAPSQNLFSYLGVCLAYFASKKRGDLQQSRGVSPILPTTKVESEVSAISTGRCPI